MQSTEVGAIFDRYLFYCVYLYVVVIKSNNLLIIFSFPVPLEFSLSSSIKWEICKWTKQSWAASGPSSCSTQVPEAGNTGTVSVCSFNWPCCVLLQMQRAFPTPVKWSSWEKKSMHHWRPTVNRNILSSRGGTVHIYNVFFLNFMYSRSSVPDPANQKSSRADLSRMAVIYLYSLLNRCDCCAERKLSHETQRSSVFICIPQIYTFYLNRCLL